MQRLDGIGAAAASIGIRDRSTDRVLGMDATGAEVAFVVVLIAFAAVVVAFGVSVVWPSKFDPIRQRLLTCSRAQQSITANANATDLSGTAKAVPSVGTDASFERKSDDLKSEAKRRT